MGFNHRYSRAGRFAFVLALGAFLFSCQATAAVHPLQVGAKTFWVEVAEKDSDRARGLMFRTEMAEDHGMLFLFEEERALTFWMKDTVLPLSIAYISKAGVIKQILDMEPFSLRPVESRFQVLYALEVNRGAFERAGVKIGDRVGIEELLTQIRK